MGCCGDKRKRIYGDPYSQTRTSGAGLDQKANHQPERAEMEFEYIGNSAMTVIGVITGNVYRFERPGAVMDIDRRDASFVTGIPNLRRLIRK